MSECTIIVSSTIDRLRGCYIILYSIVVHRDSILLLLLYSNLYNIIIQFHFLFRYLLYTTTVMDQSQMMSNNILLDIDKSKNTHSYLDIENQE